jgi:cyclophilin family peptidyl-prolyl cis-trans isomerase
MILSFGFRPLAVGLSLVCAMTLAASATAGTIVHFDTNLGNFDVELYDSAAPTTVSNFLSYVTSGAYNDTIIHRSALNFVIQGGGYGKNFAPIATNPAIPLEYSLPNERGTLAMARTSLPNTATSQWFVNTVDNSAGLGPGGYSADGYAVFGHVLGSGMDVVDAIAALPRYNAGSPFNELPLQNYASPNMVTDANKVIVNSVTVVPEPASLALGFAGSVGLVVAWRLRRKKIAG